MTVDLTRDEAIAFLTTDPETGEDTGYLRVPGSRYGRDGESCAPVAYAAACVLARETGGEVDQDTLDYVMGLVVNDHDDVAYLLGEYGTEDEQATFEG